MPCTRFPLTLNRYALSIVRYLIMKLKLVVLFLLLLAQWQCYAQASDTTVTILPLQKLTICPGDTLHAHYTVSKRFQSGNVFSAQLSDATGSFASGTIILGSYPSDTNGRIICTIPTTTIAGNTYRIRIAASAPVRTSTDNGSDITVKPKPSIAPQSNSPVCKGGTITMNAFNTTSGATVVWNGPSSYSATGSPVSIHATQISLSGKYYVTATLNGCSSTDSLNIVVNNKPVANLSTNSPVCFGDTMKMNLNWAPNTTNELVFPSGLRARNNQTYSIYGATNIYAGTYTLIVTDTNNCKDTTYQNFAIKPSPDTPDIISNAPICSGKRLQMFGLPGSTTNASFIWTGPNGFTSSSPTPFINNATMVNAGIYTLRTLFNGCYSPSVSDTITIVDIPEKPIAGSNSPICEGEGMHLFAKEVKGAYYLWVGPNNFKSNIRDLFVPNITRLATGYYIVQDSISGGCVNADTIYVEVNPYPVKTKILHNAPVCVGDSLKMNFEKESTSTKYTWWGPGITTDTNNTLYIPNMTDSKAGMYGIIANNRGCITIGDTVNVYTKPLPETPVASNNGPLWEGQEMKLSATSTTAGVKYLWSGPNGYTDTGSTVYVTNILSTQQGIYFVAAEKDGCLSVGSTTVAIRKLTTNGNVSITLYPSPNDGNFWLDIKTTEEQIIPISVHNQAGQLIMETTFATDKKFVHRHISLKGQIASGTYYLTTIVDGQKVQLPFVVNQH